MEWTRINVLCHSRNGTAVSASSYPMFWSFRHFRSKRSLCFIDNRAIDRWT